MFLALNPFKILCVKSLTRESRGIWPFFLFRNHTKRDARGMPCKVCKYFNALKQNGIIYARMYKLILKGLNYE